MARPNSSGFVRLVQLPQEELHRETPNLVVILGNSGERRRPGVLRERMVVMAGDADVNARAMTDLQSLLPGCCNTTWSDIPISKSCARSQNLILGIAFAGAAGCADAALRLSKKSLA